ncbi:HAMP domain-containing histidine kinase [Sphingomonas sp. NBWT7]|uniref:sensor histidine kinase n=1 Tax=Sphingomonas sp. NBWT7 TaxID=2596913 RepID=UPI0016296322|nr:HAMP domain-containing sensor histidine kinase [Sphingomonas sp. NBWT7]QNE33223.1 HAMP domain-containing histidine kinase [Sphingomonas sp. NBWT7]
MIDPPIVSAKLDAADRLIDADPAFLALNERAGGAIGATLATPQLATMVRLARRLRILVSRAVTIADADLDLDCWVRATPTDQGVSLAISPTRERPAWRSPSASGAVPPPADADWIWETDAGLRLQRIAPDAGARFGFDADAALGKPLTRLFALEGGDDGVLTLLEAVAAVEDFDGQPAVLRESGAAVTLAGHVRRDGSGAFAGFVGGTFHECVSSAREVEALGDTFNRRLDTILRGPLGRIVANADSINAGTEGPIDPHYADYAADIASAARHLMGLIDDLADMQAIERDDFTVEDEGIDLADVTRRAAGLLAVRAAHGDVTIDRGDLDTPLAAHGEFRRTLQIMVNLIGNAVRYSPRGATIWLKLQRDGDRAIAIVADQGKGIAPEDHERIFGKFERVDPAEAGGNGLGLYIARRLARAMGGDLTVDSAPDAGARFVLTLPAA